MLNYDFLNQSSDPIGEFLSGSYNQFEERVFKQADKRKKTLTKLQEIERAKEQAREEVERQRAIKRDKKENMKLGSRFHGVTATYSGKWRARITHKDTYLLCELYDTELEAAQAYNRTVIMNRLKRPLNSL